MEPERLASGCGFCSSLHPGTLTEHPISLTQLAHDQFRGVITNLHFVLLAHKGNLGLTKQLDQPAGVRSGLLGRGIPAITVPAVGCQCAWSGVPGTNGSFPRSQGAPPRSLIGECECDVAHERCGLVKDGTKLH